MIITGIFISRGSTPCLTLTFCWCSLHRLYLPVTVLLPAAFILPRCSALRHGAINHCCGSLTRCAATCCCSTPRPGAAHVFVTSRTARRWSPMPRGLAVMPPRPPVIIVHGHSLRPLSAPRVLHFHYASLRVFYIHCLSVSFTINPSWVHTHAAQVTHDPSGFFLFFAFFCVCLTFDITLCRLAATSLSSLSHHQHAILICPPRPFCSRCSAV